LRTARQFILLLVNVAQRVVVVRVCAARVRGLRLISWRRRRRRGSLRRYRYGQCRKESRGNDDALKDHGNPGNKKYPMRPKRRSKERLARFQGRSRPSAQTLGMHLAPKTLGASFP